MNTLSFRMFLLQYRWREIIRRSGYYRVIYKGKVLVLKYSRFTDMFTFDDGKRCKAKDIDKIGNRVYLLFLSKEIRDSGFNWRYNKYYKDKGL